jgi:hypothetical protein
MPYMSGNENLGVEVEAQVEVMGIVTKSEWVSVFTMISRGPEIYEHQLVHSTSNQIITMQGLGLESLSDFVFSAACCDDISSADCTRAYGCVSKSICGDYCDVTMNVQ